VFTFTRMEETPRSIPLIHFFVLAAGLIGGRSIARIRCWHRDKRQPDSLSQPIKNIVVVGTSRLAWFYTKFVEEFAADEQIVALLDERPKFQFRSLNGHPIAGSPLHVSQIFDEYATHGVDIHEIVVACPPRAFVICGLDGA
jgi:FlaA1/EpsC-like NDP-sugar epimerase